jgi:hypothetical protein
MIALVKELGGVPTHTWLDGTSGGESDAAGLLDFMMKKGSECLNIVPDRNWNLVDPEERNRKVAKLHEIVREADRRELPIIVGTEMNKHGQGFVDDFFSEAMSSVRNSFLRGACIMTGHTLMSLYLNTGLLSDPVVDRYGTDLNARNTLFEKIGSLKPAADSEGTEDLIREMRRIWDKGE